MNIDLTEAVLEAENLLWDTQRALDRAEVAYKKATQHFNNMHALWEEEKSRGSA